MNTGIEITTKIILCHWFATHLAIYVPFDRFHLLEGLLMDAVRKSSRSQFVLIIDLEELSFYKVAHIESTKFKKITTHAFVHLHIINLFAAINVVTSMFQDFEENYPETLFSAFIINSEPLLIDL